MGIKKDVSIVAVIGAGIMGRGIAHVAALGGFQTVLNDVSDELLQKAQSRIRQDLHKAVSIGKLTDSDVDAALARLTLDNNLDRAAESAELVIEAVPEKMELKLDVFSRLDQACANQAVLASNTSSLSITEMAAATRRPHQFIGMHFFNPVHKTNVVEIVRGLKTDDDRFANAATVSRKMDQYIGVLF